MIGDAVRPGSKRRALYAVGLALLTCAVVKRVFFPDVSLVRFLVPDLDSLWMIATLEAVYHGSRVLLRRNLFGLSSGFGLGSIVLGPFYELLMEDEDDRRPAKGA